VSAEPAFALTGPRGTLVADRARDRYPDIPSAQAALRSGAAPIVLGALPFDVDAPAALLAPDGLRRLDALPDWPTGPLPAVRIDRAVPSSGEHRERIARARDQLAAPDNSLRKVVLARALRLSADAPLDGRVVLRRLVDADPSAYGFLADLSPAGGGYAGAALVGASPELLVARSGEQVMCRPFAGSAPRSDDPDTDAANGAALAGSDKNRHEHQLVIDTMRAALEPLYASFRTLRSEVETAMRSRPATVWTQDGLRQHPLRRAADCNARFLDVLALVERAASVVLVGNAPTVLGSKLGRAIDAHDCVIRLNDFRTTGFEADVGRRTSLWYTRAHRLARPDPGSLGTAHILAQNDTPNQYPPVDEYLKGRLRVDVPFERATFLPAYVLAATDGATYAKPTTGFRIIQFLEFFCQRTYDIAGFAFFKGSGMHYFDVGEDRLQVGEMHAIDFERDFVERVLCEGRHLKRL